MRRAAVLAATLASLSLSVCLAGCGGPAQPPAATRPARLCVDVGVPLQGGAAAVGAAFLAGVRTQLTQHLAVAGARVRLCHVYDDASVALALAHAGAAARDARTVAYLGEVSSAQAAAVDLVLAAARIPLITPTGPPAAARPLAGVNPTAPLAAAAGASTAAGSGAGPDGEGELGPRLTGLDLLPSQRSQRDAAAQVSADHGCGRRVHRRISCEVLSGAASPLCSVLPPEAAPRAPARFCVLAGPDLTSWPTPAVAYGATAARILVSALAALGPGAVRSRTALMSRLIRTDLRASPVGRVRFDAAGGVEADLFTAYTVNGRAGLTLLQTLRAH